MHSQSDRYELEARLSAALVGLTDADLAALARGESCQADLQTDLMHLWSLLRPTDLRGPATQLSDAVLAAIALAGVPE